MWEEEFIQEAKTQITELWESTYKSNVVETVEFEDVEDDIFGHIFKKQRIEEKDELKIYLNEELAPGKSDILTWWKVY